jgi:murein L,D-transpeptidase YcbB/YkuD
MIRRSLIALMMTAATTSLSLASDPQTASGATSGRVQPSVAGEQLAPGSGDALARAVGAGLPDDPAPLAVPPDPLTPASTDSGPVKAPGAPDRASAQSSPDTLDPVVVAVRTRLDAWPIPPAAEERTHLAALKDFYADATAPLWTSADALTPRALLAIAALRRATENGLDAARYDVPPHPGGTASAEPVSDVEIAIGLAILRYARDARGGRIDPPALSKMIDMRPRLYEPGSILDAVAVANAPDVYLEGLHPRHEGFHTLKLALAKGRAARTDDAGNPSRKSSADVERRILVNMERWRWLPDDLGAFHVWDNVPEQLARVSHDGKVVLEERIVVGKPTTPTPIFSAPMRFVIFHPTWGVPEGIKTNELGPRLRRAQSNSTSWLFGGGDGAGRVMRQQDLRVSRGGREINPDSIDWSSVDIRQFQFTQPSGGRNVLGLVKFRFPNKHDVYMHDTTQRDLFSRSQRLFSHGCLRVQNPMKLAEVILAYDKGWSRDRISAIVARKSTTDVTLDKSVPVHIVYFTATADHDGRVATHPDVYGIDARVASALAGRSVTLASAKADAEPAAKRLLVKSPSAKQKQPRRTAASKTAASNPKFDPFSGLTTN